jgi:hemin uptake protein HemP
VSASQPEWPAGEPTAARTVPQPVRRIASDRLMAGRREIIIEHGHDQYRLRVTGSGKLILTK